MIPDYNTIIKKETKDRLIYLGLALIIIFFLLVIAGMPMRTDALEQSFNASMPGERNTGDPFIITMQNVSGQENVTHHITVYGSKLIGNDTPYQYWSVSFGQWLNQTPEKDKRWLFIWVEDWIDGSPTWSFDQNQFNVWVWGNTTIKPETIQLQDLAAQKGKKLSPAIIEGVTYGSNVRWRDYNYYGDSYGWRDGIEMPYIQTGKSNSWSGWIKYQVPSAAELKDIRVAGWFMNHGTAYWNLVDVSFIQVAPTPIPAPTIRPDQQGVVRMSDQPGAPEIDGRQRG